MRRIKYYLIFTIVGKVGRVSLPADNFNAINSFDLSYLKCSYNVSENDTVNWFRIPENR